MVSFFSVHLSEHPDQRKAKDKSSLLAATDQGRKEGGATELAMSMWVWQEILYKELESLPGAVH